MSDYILLHNSRCSKSREALALLQARNIELTIRQYLINPLDEKEMRSLLVALNISARELLRTSEPLFKELGLKESSHSEEFLIQAMCEHPKLMQRPVLMHGEHARIGRPPEKILELL